MVLEVLKLAILEHLRVDGGIEVEILCSLGGGQDEPLVLVGRRAVLVLAHLVPGDHRTALARVSPQVQVLLVARLFHLGSREAKPGVGRIVGVGRLYLPAFGEGLALEAFGQQRVGLILRQSVPGQRHVAVLLHGTEIDGLGGDVLRAGRR